MWPLRNPLSCPGWVAATHATEEEVVDAADDETTEAEVAAKFVRKG